MNLQRDFLLHKLFWMWMWLAVDAKFYCTVVVVSEETLVLGYGYLGLGVRRHDRSILLNVHRIRRRRQ